MEVAGEFAEALEEWNQQNQPPGKIFHPQSD